MSPLRKFFQEMGPVGDGSMKNPENRSRYFKTMRRVLFLCASLVAFLSFYTMPPVNHAMLGSIVGMMGSSIIGASIRPISRLVLRFEILRAAKSMFFGYAICCIIGFVSIQFLPFAFSGSRFLFSFGGIVLGFVSGAVLVSILYSMMGAFTRESNSKFN